MNQLECRPLRYSPRGDRVLVKRDAAPESKDEGIFVPNSQQSPPWEGTVIAVGPGQRNRITGYIDEIDLKPGEHVYFVEHAGYPVVIDGVEYLQMREEEIIGTGAVPWSDPVTGEIFWGPPPRSDETPE